LREMGLGASLTHVDASAEFLGALEGLADPEAKRKAIGDTFVKIFDREAAKLGLGKALLGQGTIYPDTIETGGTKRADLIKTHHTGRRQIREMRKKGWVVEPLKDLYKVGVRALGRALGLDDASLDRHPFPGPGLGIRVAAAKEVPRDFDEAGMRADIARGLLRTRPPRLPLPLPSVRRQGALPRHEHPALPAGPVPGWGRPH